MRWRTDHTVAAAALLVALGAVLGGGFQPVSRLVIGGGLMLLWIMATPSCTRRLDRAESAGVAFLLWGVVVALWVGAAPLASKETLLAWAVTWALWALSRRGSIGACTWGLRIVATAGTAVAAAVIVSACLGAHMRVGGFFDDPNLAAALLVPILPIGLVIFRKEPPWGRTVWFLVVGLGIVLTGSRAGLLASMVVIVVLLPRGRARLIGFFAGGGVALSALAWRFLSQPDPLAWHRVSIWWAVLKIWLTRPFTGVGPGCLVEAAGPERILHPDQVGRYQFVVGYSESTPLAVLVQVGLVGFLVAVVALAIYLLGARRSGALSWVPFRAGLASLLGLVLFHDFLTADPVLWWWAVVIGCLDRLGRTKECGAKDTTSPGLRVAVVLVALWFTAWAMVAPAWARMIWWGSEPTTEEIVRVLRVEPWYPEPAAALVRAALADPTPWSWEKAAEALYWAEYAKAVHPGLARWWADLGRVHLRIITDLGGTADDVIRAETDLDRACELDPFLPWNHLERARLARIVGDHQLARSLVRQVLAREPNTVRAWLLLSRLELEQGRMEAARDALLESEDRRKLIDRPGLTDYERELLSSSPMQVRSLGEKLLSSGSGRP